MKAKFLLITLLAIAVCLIWQAGSRESAEENYSAGAESITQAKAEKAGTASGATVSTEDEKLALSPRTKAETENSGISCASAPETSGEAFAKSAIECVDQTEPSSETRLSEMMEFASEVLTRSGVAAETDDGNVVTGIVEKGNTVSQILSEASEESNQHYVSALRKVFSPGAFKAGQPYTVIKDPDSGRIIRFEYEINNLRRLVVEGDLNPKARLENIHYSTVLETCAGIIEDNLFQAVTDAGENPQLAVRLASLFGSEINFVKDLQEGDSFVVLHEKKYRNGHYAGYGKILAARFVNKGKTWEAFLFRDSSGKEHYYNANGENLKKTLLQAPLAVTRLTSKFTQSRKHPILGTSRPHLGVDYGAPAGTPVKAVGDGVVTGRNWNGGYGNQVIIKHTGGLESLYAHLSKFARGLKPGQKVRQGEVIGYVGSTGLSTGPHLDFRIRQNGAFINPTKAINPRGTPVPPGLKTAFAKAVKQERGFLNGDRLPREYAIDMFIPHGVASEEHDIVSTPVIKDKRNRAGKARRMGNRKAAHKRS